MCIAKPGMGGRAKRRTRSRDPQMAALLAGIIDAARENDTQKIDTLVAERDALLPEENLQDYPFEFGDAIQAAIQADHVEAAESLLKTKRIILEEFFPEIIAAQKWPEFLNLFLQYGFKLDETWTRNKHEPLWYITIPQHLDALFLILMQGIDINYWDNTCRTPLDRAARHGSIKAFKLLVSHGAKVEESDALISAAGSDQQVLYDESPVPAGEISEGKIVAMMDYLLTEVGVDVNAISVFPRTRHRSRSWKQTALHTAVAATKHSRVVYLLDRGADPGIKDCFGRTPAQAAREWAEQDYHERDENGEEPKHRRESKRLWKSEAEFLEKWVEEKSAAGGSAPLQG